MGYSVTLEKFEGPLDLLLHLIQKNKIDIYDISIFEITNQYFAQMQKWQQMDMDIASEFIVMASRLLEMKSIMLLPRSAEAEETPEDMRENLIRQLVEYRMYKRVSDFVSEQEAIAQRMIYKDPEFFRELESEEMVKIDLEEIMTAYGNLLGLVEDVITTDFAQQIKREEYTIEEKITLIFALFEEKKEETLHFTELFKGKTAKNEVVVTFLAILELYKSGLIELYQHNRFKQIIIQMRKVA